MSFFVIVIFLFKITEYVSYLFCWAHFDRIKHLIIKDYGKFQPVYDQILKDIIYVI